MFAALVAYKDAFGDCNVPRVWPENPKLASWVYTKRPLLKKGDLSEGHLRRLKEIGFTSDVLDAQWEEMFAAIVAYKDAYGDCNVPAKWPANRKLASWVVRMRRQRKKETLSRERARRLNEIEFVWDRNDALWEEMFTALVAYKDAYGDCNVPDKWTGNRKLASWIGTQRQSRRKKTRSISEERIKRLNEIGFAWLL